MIIFDRNTFTININKYGYTFNIDHLSVMNVFPLPG